MGGGRDGGERRITVTPDGPYRVRGDVPLVRRRIVRSEAGEALTWQTTRELPAPSEYALCRCGNSSTRPFCDGTHRRRGFDGTETAPPTRYQDRQRTYPGDGFVLRDDRSICAHAGFCSNRVSNVWKLTARSQAGAVRAAVMAMIERCPSGALTYRLEPDGPDVEPDLRPAIGVIEDGPLAVTGSITVERADGTVAERRARVLLCRCGGSGAKPFCDGSHAARGFRDR